LGDFWRKRPFPGLEKKRPERLEIYETNVIFKIGCPKPGAGAAPALKNKLFPGQMYTRNRPQHKATR
jgi:hypothetical protein